MKKSMLSIIGLAILIYIGACILLYTQQRSFIYLPTDETTPSINNKINQLTIQSQDETVKLWHIDQNPEQAIIYFGGNAEEVSWNIPLFSMLFPQHSIYLVNYRGYGGSSGSPSEQALYQDALAIYDQLKPKHRQISLIGRSLGSGVACYLASTRDIDKLILVTPFDSLENIAKQSFPWFPVSILLKDKYDSASRAASIQSPTLILIAEQDEIIPLSNSEKLAEAFKQAPLTIKVIPNTSHNNIEQSFDYTEALKHFL